jgi:HSP20 family protein
LEGSWTPAVDVYDSKDDILVKADLPGLKKEDIEVTVEDNRLILKGEKKNGYEEESGKDFLKSERFYGSFYRALGLPVAVNAERVKAVYKDGVLELTLPKREEVKPKQIDIRVN